MQCPRCRMEMRLLRRQHEDGKTLSFYICRDKRCEGSKTQLVKETKNEEGKEGAG